MQIRKAKVISGSFKGATIRVEGTDLERLGRPWYENINAAGAVYAIREDEDNLPEEGTVYCCHHLDGKKQGLSDLFHEIELEFVD
ncbi:hypothetical protein [Priestia megaterium]|uniref:hypothetical protein n=1 Tax=Priestia megaterium TaxID=1404 RepID=UPI002E20BFC9|nr:hypothetical protein [Priestia megaterium]